MATYKISNILSFLSGGVLSVACWYYTGTSKCDNILSSVFLNRLKASETAGSCVWHLESLGYPSTENLHFKKDHILSYNHRTRNANWVFEVLTQKKCYSKNAERTSSQFTPDNQVPKEFKVLNKDFLNSGYDRGHLAAAANHTQDQDSMDDTFLLTNISPQISIFNEGCWSNLEQHARRLTRNYSNVYVFTGPLYMPQPDRSGKMYTNYQVIGTNLVAVPTHFFKVIAYEDTQSQKLLFESYILPNKSIKSEQRLVLYLRDIETVEKCSGLLFFRARNRLMVKKADVEYLYRQAMI